MGRVGARAAARVHRGAGRAGGLPARGHRGRVVGCGARGADGRPARRGPRVARPCRRRVRHQLAVGSGRELGTADRDDALPPDRGRSRRRASRCHGRVDAGASDAPGPIGGYCAALALLVLGRDGDAEVVAARTADEGLEPAAVADALGALARGDGVAYEAARLAVLRSFEERDAFLEDVRVRTRCSYSTRSHASAGSSRPRSRPSSSRRSQSAPAASSRARSSRPGSR